eukprot:gene265-2388_t
MLDAGEGEPSGQGPWCGEADKENAPPCGAATASSSPKGDVYDTLGNHIGQTPSPALVPAHRDKGSRKRRKRSFAEGCVPAASIASASPCGKLLAKLRDTRSTALVSPFVGAAPQEEACKVRPEATAPAPASPPAPAPQPFGAGPALAAPPDERERKWAEMEGEMSTMVYVGAGMYRREQDGGVTDLSKEAYGCAEAGCGNTSSLQYCTAHMQAALARDQ